MSTFNNPFALEEPSEGRTTANAFRDASRSQSLRQSQVANNQYTSSSVPPAGRSSANNDVTVDSLLNKIDNLLQQSQTPTPSRPQFSFGVKQEGVSYSQAQPINQGVNPFPSTNAQAPNLRQSISLENGKQKKNEIFAKKSYDNPLWNNQTVMTSPVKDIYPQRQSEKRNEIFTVFTAQENPKASSLFATSPSPSVQPAQDLNIARNMDDIRSKIGDLENQLNAIKNPRTNNFSDPYVTPRNQSVPPLRSDALFPTTVPRESEKKSTPYAGQDYYSYSVEKPKSQTPGVIETNPQRDAEVSDQICQTIDNLIQTHMFNQRSPTKSTASLTQRNYYTSPTRDLYGTSASNPLYKSSVLPTDKATEPVHKSLPPTYKSTIDSYPTYESRYDPVSTYDKYETRPYEPTSSYKSYSDYEPLSKYDKYDTEPLSKYDKYESRPYEPSSSYQPTSSYQPYSSTYDKYDTKYDTKCEPYDKYDSRSNYESSYEPRNNYEKDSKSSPYASSYRDNYGDTNRTRPHYVRPLYRNSPPRYATQGNEYRSPQSNDYYNKYSNSTLSTPARESPMNQEAGLTDKKLKKLTLKSKVSEEKDGDRFDHRHTSGKKDFRSSPPNDSYGPERRSYKSGDLLSDNEDTERLPRHKTNAAPVKKQTRSSRPEPEPNQHDNKRASYKSGNLVSDNEDTERERLPKQKTSTPAAPVKQQTRPSRPAAKQNGLVNAAYKSGDLLSDNEGTERTEVIERAATNTQKSQRKVNAAAPPANNERPAANKKKNSKNNYRAGDLESDDDFQTGELMDDDTPRHTHQVEEVEEASEDGEWEEREDELARQKEAERERERQRVKEQERERERQRVREQEREREREKVREQERQRMRQSRITKNIPDDGKDWKMVHRIPSAVFEDAENSFDFDQIEKRQKQEASEAERKRAAKVNNQATIKPVYQQPRKESGKMIWAMEESVDMGQRKSLSNLSDSVRRSQKKPVLTHCFEKSDRLGY